MDANDKTKLCFRVRLLNTSVAVSCFPNTISRDSKRMDFVLPPVIDDSGLPGCYGRTRSTQIAQIIWAFRKQKPSEEKILPNLGCVVCKWWFLLSGKHESRTGRRN